MLCRQERCCIETELYSACRVCSHLEKLFGWVGLCFACRNTIEWVWAVLLQQECCCVKVACTLGEKMPQLASMCCSCCSPMGIQPMRPVPNWNVALAPQKKISHYWCFESGLKALLAVQPPYTYEVLICVHIINTRTLEPWVWISAQPRKLTGVWNGQKHSLTISLIAKARLGSKSVLSWQYITTT